MVKNLTNDKRPPTPQYPVFHVLGNWNVFTAYFWDSLMSY